MTRAEPDAWTCGTYSPVTPATCTAPVSTSVRSVVGSGMIRITSRSRYGRPPSSSGYLSLAAKTQF